MIAADGRVWVYHAGFAENGSRVCDSIASELRIISKDGPKLAQTCFSANIVEPDSDVFSIVS